ncbi:hypothetical protein B5M42_002165 [Paenibacillus athensensis]|uniref:hypothetical protein n=1 Tax=Paenibacillus athensensis TaxID=1967502 RepID=UPI0014312AD4|nr:hypothetical protein [Paenibacillus athensensis]MCD1257643.1 hypothetical protein [Paenibacillus athensensis]
MAEECFACGNKNKKEIEYKKVILDDGEKEVAEIKLVCKDQYECGMRMHGPKK